ncbi:turripeptide Gsg9.2-like [Biomphalaria glabrata]|uniref:Turripeptide Gsg9.2-like n=1 Tax=Biomphalaria glabrata TaxID=6526 RepID=A0A9W2ZE75_BIOGL|nr:turripeptide Gsg9.2-like [Biomphalaria glabrata]
MWVCFGGCCFKMKASSVLSILVLLLAVLLQELKVNAQDDDRCLVICTADWNPVCGSNGKTYPNKCELDGENRCLRPSGPLVTIAHEGPCSPTTEANK